MIEEVTILAIDPGPEKSGLVVYSHYSALPILEAVVSDNQSLLDRITESDWKIGCLADMMAIEMVASYGMPVGREVFETCVWIGRFVQAWHARTRNPWRMVYRKDVKSHLCGSMRATDANIRQSLIDRLGTVGTKKSPGPLYGVKSHIWPALAVAIYCKDKP